MKVCRLPKNCGGKLKLPRCARNIRQSAPRMSFGVSQFNGSESPEHAISRADKALYAVKENGRNGVRLAADETPAANPA
jgi:GGDEF domain-containing protein